ncbi:unnamed protein product [Rotaria socialis]|uniref:Uncharacterized protein n=1 Tax=Rotaria socialis TaxID=392032 RepID=A0A820V670_9BILA|nr:unnamed protein product [Rotaria socialis]CAF3379233.1 unnamed protein product [Rotaria socialis]CAF3432414.1 unnamed protein product [Rotaria socialis]CAF3437901.1 unnamed protein product [Rotaria socialis]CAF3723976.1 unnamed protein product [Rotaria socialis]
MNKSIIFALLVALLGIDIATSQTKFTFPVEACIGGLANGSYVGCAAALASSILKIHQWGEDTPINVCGNQCTSNLKGRFSSWKWKWDAKFQCSTKGQGIVGTSTALSRNGSVQGAIQDWITKASKSGAINVNDFKC